MRSAEIKFNVIDDSFCDYTIACTIIFNMQSLLGLFIFSLKPHLAKEKIQHLVEKRLWLWLTVIFCMSYMEYYTIIIWFDFKISHTIYELSL